MRARTLGETADRVTGAIRASSLAIDSNFRRVSKPGGVAQQRGLRPNQVFLHPVRLHQQRDVVPRDGLFLR